MNSGTVINPLTNRPINVGSVVYNKLVRRGVIDDGASSQYAPIKQPKYAPIKQPQPMISRAYSGLRNQIPQYQQQSQPVKNQFSGLRGHQPVQQKVKLTPQEKIKNVISSSVKAYKNTLETVDPEEFDDDDELESYLTQELVKNLKSSGNKHLNKYL